MCRRYKIRRQAGSQSCPSCPWEAQSWPNVLVTRDFLDNHLIRVDFLRWLHRLHRHHGLSVVLDFVNDFLNGMLVWADVRTASTGRSHLDGHVPWPLANLAPFNRLGQDIFLFQPRGDIVPDTKRGKPGMTGH